MHIKKLKVRPRKTPFETPCGPVLQGMLNCMAAHNDVHALGACEEAAQELFDCMRQAPMGKQRPRSTINYHLKKLQKLLK